MAALNLVGKTFGQLTVLERDFSIKKNCSYWLCKCSCGNFKTVRGTSLTSGHTQSCGCLRKANVSKLHEANVKDIKGQKFGLLTALEISERNNGNTFWNCQCECGNITKVRIDSLTSGNTKSCGCINSKGEQIIAKILKDNQIIFIQQYSFPDLNGQHNKPLRFDFAILSLDNTVKCVIEFQGIQHYSPQKFFGGQERFVAQQANDNKKEEYCKQNDIPLIIFDYKELNKIDTDYFKNKLLSKGVLL